MPTATPSLTKAQAATATDIRRTQRNIVDAERKAAAARQLAKHMADRVRILRAARNEGISELVRDGIRPHIIATRAGVARHVTEDLARAEHRRHLARLKAVADAKAARRARRAELAANRGPKAGA